MTFIIGGMSALVDGAFGELEGGSGFARGGFPEAYCHRFPRRRETGKVVVG